ncbi:hypothetical protein [Wolbachia endosymbiont (group A) of Barypeithes pellucidus]|uniref:hypothetical protein n=1 Tax=Wolbachia endosymbiont (group A) of Barypeithes pellucidus TaxID=3139322 RepID=UPI003CCA9F9B
MIGLLDQKISTRPSLAEDLKELKRRSHNTALPIEEKESIRYRLKTLLIPIPITRQTDGQ